jgi:hypothetical protein
MHKSCGGEISGTSGVSQHAALDVHLFGDTRIDATANEDPHNATESSVLEFTPSCFPCNKTRPGSGVGDYTANVGGPPVLSCRVTA